MKLITTRIYEENAQAWRAEKAIGEIRHGREIGHGGSPSQNSQSYIWVACIRCNKARWVRYQVKAGLPEFSICNSCRGKERIGERNGNWRGGKAKAICLECGNIFERPKAWMKKSGKFCSNSCEMIHQRKSGIFNIKPNNPEKVIIALLEQAKLPFKYVGDGKIWIGRRNPDFLNINGKKQVIELLGTYWHLLFDGAQRKEHYKQYGFDCLIIWEDELSNEPRLLAKLKRFSRSICN